MKKDVQQKIASAEAANILIRQLAHDRATKECKAALAPVKHGDFPPWVIAIQYLFIIESNIYGYNYTTNL